MTIIQPEFLAGGYVLTRPVERDDEYMSSELLPEPILTLSSCLADLALEYWWNEENVAQAADFGVPAPLWPELISRYLDQFGSSLGAPGVAYSPWVIREFVERFVSEPADLVILGCGIAPDHAARLIRDYRTPPERGEYGVFGMIERQVAFEDGGEPLGFEVLSYEYGLEHSWLCNLLEREAAEQFDMAPDPRGFIDSFADATRVADHANRDDIGTEPGLWLPWLVVQYPIAST